MSAPTLSRRGLVAPTSPIRRLARLADEARERGIEIHALNIGQPEVATPREIVRAYQSYDETVLAYAPSDGLPAYRHALAHYYSEVSAEGGGGPVGADEIVVTTGGSEALLFATAAVCDPGDEVIVSEPFYANYGAFAHMLSVSLTALTTEASAGYRLDPTRLDRAITDRTRALVVSSPGNPTGVVLSEQELTELAAVCRRHGLFLICDEVYRDFVYDGLLGERAPSVLSVRDFEEHAIVADSVSKRYSACGARVGALVTRNRAVRNAALRFAQARLSVATVDQLAAMAALATPPSLLRSTVNAYAERRDALVDSLHRIGVTCSRPEGAFYLMATLPVLDADDFCEFLLRDFSLSGETVMLAPASGFYVTPGLGTDEVRMTFLLTPEKLGRSARIIGAALDAYGSRGRRSTTTPVHGSAPDEASRPPFARSA